MTPYKNLLNEIEKRHLKYFEVAELLGLSASNFRNKMCGRYHFTDKDIDKLVEFFGLPAEYLMARDDGLPTTISKLHKTPYKNLLIEIDKRHLTYRGLSKLTEISKSVLPLKISDKVKFTDKEKATLAEFFGKPIEYLFFKEEFL